MDDQDLCIPRDSGDDPPPPVASLGSKAAVTGLEEEMRRLRALSRVQELFISGGEPREIYWQMLDLLLQATGSAFGFLDEIRFGEDRTAISHRLALGDGSQEAGAGKTIDNLEARALELGRLVSAPALEGRTVIANDTPNDPRHQHLPGKPPPIARCLGVPLRHGDELVGVVGVAGRPDAYTEELATSVEPLIRACATMVWADQTRRRNRERETAIAASEERYRGIAMNLSDVVWIADLDLNATYVSPSVERLFGDTPEEHLRRRLEEKFPPAGLERLRAVFAEEMVREQDPSSDPGRTREVEVQHYRSDGSVIWVAMHLAFVRDEAGRAIGIQGATRDISTRKRLELALAESERKWRGILVDTPQVGVSLDPQARVVFANDHFLELTGWAEHEVLGRDWFVMFIPEEIREEVRRVFLTVMGNRDTSSFSSYENEILTRTGELRTIAWSNVVTKNVLGEAVDVTCLGIDLTERLRAEEHSRWLADIVDNSLNEIFVFDARTLVFGYANQGALRNLQLTLEEITRMTPVDLKPEFTEETFRAAIRPLLCGAKESLVLETIHRRADGSEYPVEVHLQLMESAGDQVFLTVIFDITERRSAEAAVRESEERYRLLVENANELVLMAQDGRFVFVNRRALSFLGYTPEELIGRSFTDYIHPEDRAAVVQNHLRRLAGEDLPETYPFRILHRSGETRWVEIGAVRVDWQGRPATLNFLLDITERRRAEEAREALQSQLLQAQKMESIGRLAGGVAHDFNNMLGVILARTEMLQADTPAADPRSEDLEEIRKAAVRSADLTRQLLAFARRQTIAPKVLDLNDTVEGMLKMLRRLIGEDVDLVWRPDADLWPVKMDPAQVDQILANLSVNARDAISEAGVVTIETRSVEMGEAMVASLTDAAPGRYVTLSVTDTGSGMDEQVLSHLFEPFFTTKEQGKGTGLGLATVYGITRQNNGFIQVRSEVGQGTSFTVYLPAYQGHDGPPAEPAPVEMPRARGETVMLVEDDPAILKVAVRMLARLGYDVVSASEPDQAVKMAREHLGAVHLLITDVVMPQRSGKALAEEIQAVCPGVRVLYMSGYTANVIAHRGVLDEGVHFLQKPFSMHELAVKTREILDRRA